MKKLGENLAREIKKRDDRGMTLIEILVAMTILAIVIVPTLQIFVSSSSHNLRSRRQQRATTVGESVMESFKAYSMETLVEQFAKHEFKGAPGTPTTNVKVRNAAGAEMSLTADPDPAATPDAPDTNAVWLSKPLAHENLANYLSSPGVLNPTAASYEFKIEGAEMEAQLYDITVNVTPRTLNGAVAMAATPSVLKMEDVNRYQDAVICLNPDQKYYQEEADAADDTISPLEFVAAVKEAILRDVIAKDPGHVTDPDTAYADSVDLAYTDGGIALTEFYRFIDVGAHTSGGSDIVQVTINCEFQYRINNLKYEKDDGTQGTTSVQSTGLIRIHGDVNGVTSDNGLVLKAYDNSNTIAGQGGTLETIYLYYTPLYFGLDNSMGDFTYTSPEDQINIHNMTGRSSINAVVMKQFPRGYFDADGRLLTEKKTSLANADYYYANVFRLITQNGVKVRTNLLESILVTESQDSSGAEISASDLTQPGTMENRLATRCVTEGGLSLTSDTVQIFRESSDTIKERALIYDVEVKVCESGKTDVLATFVGTINER